MDNFEHRLSGEHLGKILILGKGVTGEAVKDYLSKCDESRVDLIDEVTEDELDTSKTYDLCIASPGISEFSDFYLKAKDISAEVISEVEFAFRESEPQSKWVAITGTNGKTTTTALTAHLINEAGGIRSGENTLRAVAVGNIGDTCISQVDGVPKVYVAECSSYQLASIKDFAPDACAILNVTPDHIKWHQTLENYALAKFRIFENSSKQAESLVYLGCDLDEMESSDAALAPAKAALIELESQFECKLYDEKTSPVAGVVEELGADLQIKGAHNVKNAICAATLANFVGVDAGALKDGLLSFSPLEHRIEPCGEIDGVKFFNDSKATNVDSTIKALSAFSQGSVILLLGGRDKMSDLSPLVEECELAVNGKSRVKDVVCFGEAKDRFYDAFAPSKTWRTLKCPTLIDAFEAARSVAQPGDSVLLSPACASFDEFSGFEERGAFFKDLVHQVLRIKELIKKK